MFFDESEYLVKIPQEEKETSMQEMKRVLLNAIKMQALYSDGRLKVVETSDLIN